MSRTETVFRMGKQWKGGISVEKKYCQAILYYLLFIHEVDMKSRDILRKLEAAGFIFRMGAKLLWQPIL